MQINEAKRTYFRRQADERRISKLPRREQIRDLIEQQRRDARSRQSFSRR